MNHRRFLATLLCPAAILATACGAPATSTEATNKNAADLTINNPVGPVTIYDPCLTATPDDTLYISTTWDPDAPANLWSTNGGYGYRTGCNAYVADVEVDWNSNSGTGETGPLGSGGIGQPPLAWWGGAVDLPSSAAALSVDPGGVHPVVPNNATDCARYVESVTMYEGNLGGTLAFVYDETHKGTWVNGACQVSVSASATTRPMMTYPAQGAPTRVYRFAVQTSLRTSFQETGLYMWEVEHTAG